MLAALSGFSEELFFRGLLLPQVGLLWSSVIFGVLHTGSRKLIPMGAWAAVVGALLALVYLKTGNLFIPMVAHGVNNFVSICFLRYYFKPDKAETAESNDGTGQ